MSNSNTTKSAKDLHEEVTRLGTTQDLSNRLFAKAARKMDGAVYALLESELAQIEGADELEVTEMELVIQRAHSLARGRDAANGTLFAYNKPTWYLNLLATGLTVVGVQAAVSYAKNWVSSMDSQSDSDETKSHPFSDASASSSRPPLSLRNRKVDPATAAAMN